MTDFFITIHIIWLHSIYFVFFCNYVTSFRLKSSAIQASIFRLNEIRSNIGLYPKYIVELAKSNQSICSHCYKIIQKDELRFVSILYTSTAGRREYRRHLRCVSKKQLENMGDLSNLGQFTWLDSKHQEFVKNSFTAIKNGDVISNEIKSRSDGKIDIKKDNLDDYPMASFIYKKLGNNLNKPNPVSPSLKLTEEQQQIVNCSMDQNVLVIACAGSGKTVTMIKRVQYLINHGIDDNSIILTTFTRQASTDIKNKLRVALQRNHKIIVRTIDSLSLKVLHGTNATNEIRNLDEYSLEFIKMLRNNPTYLMDWNKKYLFVDEVQDVNDIHFQLIQEFYKQNVKIFAVGDDAQSIYGFRGSNISYILNFKAYFDNTTVYSLTKNYRSTKPIIDLANSVIEKSIDLHPKVMMPKDDIIEVENDDNDNHNDNNSNDDEVEGNEERMTNSTRIKTRSYPYDAGDIQKPVLRYFRNEIEEAMAIIREIYRLFTQGVKGDEIAILCSVRSPLITVENQLCEKGIKNIFIERRDSLSSSLSFLSKKAGHVTLSTIHQAKGSEWNYVFVISLSHTLLPKEISKEEKLSEEISEGRRLFYVAVTRPRRKLYLSYFPNTRAIRPWPTRYLIEIQDEDVYTMDYMTSRHMPSVETMKENDKYKGGKHGLSLIKVGTKIPVTELIENINGKQIQYLRDNGIIPTIKKLDTVEVNHISERHDFPKYVKEYHLYSDYGIFIENVINFNIHTMIHHQNGSNNSNNNRIRDHSTEILLYAVRLNMNEFYIYLSYQYYISSAIRCYDENNSESYAMIIKTIATIFPDWESLNISTQDTIKRIITMIFQSLQRYRQSQLSDILVVPYNYLSDEFYAFFEEMYFEYQSYSIDRNKVQKHSLNEVIWHISKCYKIVRENRRRLLYLGNYIERNLQNYKLLESIDGSVSAWIKEKSIKSMWLSSFSSPSFSSSSSFLSQRQSVSMESMTSSTLLTYQEQFTNMGVTGIVDIRMNRVLIDIKTTSQEEFQHEWLMQLLCYKALCNLSGIQIDKIGILNPLLGMYQEIDVSTWNKQSELLHYLIQHYSDIKNI